MPQQPANAVACGLPLNDFLAFTPLFPKMNIAMTQTILVRESVLGNPDSHEFRLEVPAEQVTVEELIRSRVFQEVKDLNLKANTKGPRYSGLV